jgi:pimeloyl-ACP methyl ester carboxylesterase
MSYRCLAPGYGHCLARGLRRQYDRRVRRLAGLVALLLGLVAAAPAAAAVRLKPCTDTPDGPGALCGSIRVPLDRSDPSLGTIRIGFELYRRRDRSRPRVGTILSVEGGPGYSTTSGRALRLSTHGPLMGRRDLLLIDVRGVGRSSPIDCPALQGYSGDYIHDGGLCGKQLGKRAHLYGSGPAADDFVAVMDALGIGKVDLYGDSYGTFLAQTFAVRHPTRVRSVVLDAAYPVEGLDPLYPEYGPAVRRALQLICQRSPACQASGIDPVGTLAALLDDVRANGRTVSAPDGDGVLRRVRVDAQGVVDAVVASGYVTIGWRDLLGAARAWMAGDRRPLGRLVAEAQGDPQATAGDVRDFSEGLYLAVTCHDYPQAWDVHASFAARRQQWEDARAALPAGTFAPFTTLEWTTLDIEGLDACLEWPAPPKDDPPIAPGTPYPDVPVLVLNGDLDIVTTTSEAQAAAARFPHATYVEVANSVHVTALGDRDDCASRIMLRFVRALSPGDTSCAARVPEVRTIVDFPRTQAAISGVTARAGNRASARSLRIAAAAAMTAEDAVQRWQVNFSGTGRGLRGGTWAYDGDPIVTFQLDRARFVTDVAVSGTVTWNITTGRVRASVTTRGPGRIGGRLRLSWSLRRSHAIAQLRGRVNGRVLHAQMVAP